jgi:hypothetical protein
MSPLPAIGDSIFAKASGDDFDDTGLRRELFMPNKRVREVPGQ